MRGGMGEVYLCTGDKSRYPCALKTFQHRLLANKAARISFTQEVATWISLGSHPNVVQCYSMEELDEVPFLRIEWVLNPNHARSDLRSVTGSRPVPLRRALDIAISVCDGLIHAQDCTPELVHRDLKPENILVASSGIVKITDWGLAKTSATTDIRDFVDTAKFSPTSLTCVGKQAMGTPLYMSPEQWRGEAVDQRSDLYALACILFELLTGRPPFVGTSLKELSRQVLRAPRPDLPRDLPSDLNLILGRCLSIDIGGRPQNTSALRADLSSIYKQVFGESAPLPPSADEDDVIQLVNRGATFGRIGFFEDALKALDAALAIRPDDPVALTNRGHIRNGLEQFAIALTDFNRAIEIDPDYSPAYVNRGNTYASMGEEGRALADYAVALQLDSQLSIAYYNRAEVMRELGRIPEAIDDLTTAIDLAPGSVKSFSTRANLYCRIGKIDEAMQDYAKAIELEPLDKKVYYNRANACKDAGMYAQALTDYSESLALDSDYQKVYANRSNVYAALGRHDEALADCDRAIELDPNDALAHTNRGASLMDLGRFEDALAAFDRAIALNPAHFDALNNRGALYHQLGNAERAIEDLTQALKVDPNRAEPYLNIANMLSEDGEHARALDFVARAAQLGSPIARHMLEQIDSQQVRDFLQTLGSNR